MTSQAFFSKHRNTTLPVGALLDGNLTQTVTGKSVTLTPAISDLSWLQKKFQQNIQRAADTVIVQYGGKEYALVADYNFAFNDPHWGNADLLGKQIGGKIGIIQDPFGKNGEPTFLGATTPIVGGAVEHLSLTADGKLYADVLVDEQTAPGVWRVYKPLFVWDAPALIQAALEAKARGQTLTTPIDRIKGITGAAGQIATAIPQRYNGARAGEYFGWMYGIGIANNAAPGSITPGWNIAFPSQSHAWNVADLIHAAVAMPDKDRMSKHINVKAYPNIEQLVKNNVGLVAGTFFDDGPVVVNVNDGRMGDVVEVDLKKLAADVIARELLKLAKDLPETAMTDAQRNALVKKRDEVIQWSVQNFTLNADTIDDSDTAAFKLVRATGNSATSVIADPYTRGGKDSDVTGLKFKDTGRMYLAPNITATDETTLRNGGRITDKVTTLLFKFQAQNDIGLWEWRQGIVTVTAKDIPAVQTFFGDRPLDNPGYSAFTLHGEVSVAAQQNKTIDVLDVYRVEQRLRYFGFPAMHTGTGNTLKNFDVNGTFADEEQAALKLFEKVVRYGSGIGSAAGEANENVAGRYTISAKYTVSVQANGVTDQSNGDPSLDNSTNSQITWNEPPTITIAATLLGAAKDAAQAEAEIAWADLKQKTEAAVAAKTNSTFITALAQAKTDLKSSLYGRDDFNSKGADGLIETSGAERDKTLSWLGAYNAPHWMVFFGLNANGTGKETNDPALSSWISDQTGAPNTAQSEQYGTSWLRDLMVARQYAPESLRPLHAPGDRRADFKGSVDGNWGFSLSPTQGHKTHDLGMAMDMRFEDFVAAINMNDTTSTPAISIPADIGRGWNNTVAEQLAALLNATDTNGELNNQQAAFREFLSLYYVTQNDIKDSSNNNQWVIQNGASDTDKQTIQTALFRGENTNNNSLISFVHVGQAGKNRYTQTHQVLTQLNVGSSWQPNHKNHFHTYIKPPVLLPVAQTHNLLASGGGLTDVGLLNVSADSTRPIYGKKPLTCSEVKGADTNYDPNSFDSTNVLRPEFYAIHSILKLELDKSEGPTDSYMAKYNSLMKNVQVTVVQPPKHGTLLPVQVSEDKVYKGFFFMAEQGYFGRDKVVFSVKFGNGQTVLLTNIVSVVDSLVTDRFSLESERAQDPCSTTPSEYNEMRQKNSEEIKRKYEEMQTLNESGQDYFADDSGAWGLIGWATGQQEVTDQFVWNNADPLATVLANASLSFAGFADLPAGALGQTTGNAITLDSNAAGNNWFIDPTPSDNSEYLPTSNPNEWVAKAGSAAAGKMDMLSVLLHEYGHALGIDHNADAHDYMGTTLTAGIRRLPTPDELALMGQLIAQAKSGLASNNTQDNVPNPFPTLPLGGMSLAFAGLLQRNRYGSLNAVLNNSTMTQYDVAANSTLVNGNLVGRVTPADATQPTAGVTRPTLDGWNTQGSVTFTPSSFDTSGRTIAGFATLNEVSTTQTRLNQVFMVNTHDRYLSFTLSGTALDDMNGAPDDAFEVALLNANTGVSLLSSNGLTHSDAFLNLQADGTEHLASGVTRINNADGSRTYRLDLSGVASGTAVNLSFDLIGFGVSNSHVNVSDVRLSGLPQLHDDAVTLLEDGTSAKSLVIAGLSQCNRYGGLNVML